MGWASTQTAAFFPAVATDLVLEACPTPSPGPGEVLIRNHAIAINPVDWKRQAWGFMIPSYPAILGSDIAGIVAEVGESVTAVKPGDRVLGLAHGFPPRRPLCFVPAATVPIAAATAVVALYDVLGLPQPSPDKAPNSSASSILVWGASSAVGSIVVQLARLSGLTVFAAASERHHAHLRSLGASVVVDYHSPTAVADLVAAAKKAGKEIEYAVDAICEPDTIKPTVEVLSASTAATKKVVHTLDWPAGVPQPEGIQNQQLCHEALPKWLETGAIVPLQHRVIEGGLGGIQNAMDQVKKGISGEKLVVEL
ncbi:chaperonin 10-like protein [Ilyonectria robusta]|uniref:chaperonin 10-like protein n=1 Tax=Ilyonectria robusta TaxID=1079257 RepID=UPI001E8D2EFF|nr:chaperonin 10-like protein [Ilyonectria robusta]KAH8646521.1 chaperonin 10-like protein [Ilyonectria robusta]